MLTILAEFMCDKDKQWDKVRYRVAQMIVNASTKDANLCRVGGPQLNYLETVSAVVAAEVCNPNSYLAISVVRVGVVHAANKQGLRCRVASHRRQIVYRFIVNSEWEFADFPRAILVMKRKNIAKGCWILLSTADS